jgi:outer membrane protein assembly factor BamC
MMIRKTPRTLALTALVASLSGCGMLNSVLETDRVDYKTSKKAAPLDVPPDLTQLSRDNRYAIPDGRGVATASGLANRGAAPVAGMPASAEPVGPINSADVRVERNGNQRWLVVKRTPEQIWPQLREFWKDSGFALVVDNAATGVMETEWAENRAKIPQDFLRRAIGKVADGLYSTGERDKYRTRVERAADGSTEIYISHRGAEEVLTGSNKEIPQWTVRANDPGLEAQFLSSLLARLGGAPDVKAAKVTVDNAAPQPVHAKLIPGADGGYVEVDEGYDRAWRRVGLALDRVGFTVEDRDRVQGVYFVRYVDPDSAPQGFFSKLFSWGDSDKAKEAQRYRVTVKAAQGASVSEVRVQTNDGKVDTGPTGAKIIKLLAEELK